MSCSTSAPPSTAWQWAASPSRFTQPEEMSATGRFASSKTTSAPRCRSVGRVRSSPVVAGVRATGVRASARPSGGEFGGERIEMVGPLGEHQHVAPGAYGVCDVRRDLAGPLDVVDEGTARHRINRRASLRPSADPRLPRLIRRRPAGRQPSWAHRGPSRHPSRRQRIVAVEGTGPVRRGTSVGDVMRRPDSTCR